MDALEALLAERRKHEGYLEKLEERRAGTPEHVFARLRDEYLTKLTDLQVRAAAEAEALATGIEEEQAAVEEIDQRLAAVQEERLEGQLRAEVGEYDAKDWSKKLTVLNATIAQLEKEREAKAGAYERTLRLLNDARSGIAAVSAGPGAASAAPAAAPPVSSHEPTSAPSAPPPAARPPASGAPDGAAARGAELAGSPSFDELAFLNAVVGRASTPVPIPPSAPVPRASRPVPVESEPPTVPMASPRAPTPARAPVSTITPPPAAAAAPVPDVPQAPAPEPAPAPAPAPVAPAPPAPAAESPSAPPPEEAADEPPGPLGRPTPRTSQAVKTLKCQECGTLNYPTEWYCERCGGELAAL
jgi:hypothetical protein